MIIIPGTSLPALSNPGAASDLKNGKQLIDSNGNVITGSMPNVSAASPSISVSTGGLITASYTQEEGYIAGTTKNATKQLTTQAGTTITPGTTQKTACASGRYTTGNIYVAGDSDLKAENIKSGVNIFGVAGSLVSTKFYIMELQNGTVSSSGSSGNNRLFRIPFKRPFPSDASTSWNIITYCAILNNTYSDTAVFGGVGMGDGGLYQGGATYASPVITIYNTSYCQISVNYLLLENMGTNQLYIGSGSHIVISPDFIGPV